MDSPYAIHIRCDGSMDYDSKQTGGFGFIIEFPDSTGLEPTQGEVRADGEGIHRLEMMAVLKGMNELIRFQKANPQALRSVSGVEIHSDRLSVSEMNNPYRVRDYRKAGWKTYEGKPVKHDDLLDAIDKARKKLGAVISGRIEIVYTREKKNKAADKLSKLGKRGVNTDKTLLKRARAKVRKRKLTGSEVSYGLLSEGDILDVHPFYKDPVQKEFEVKVEILDGDHTGKTMKIYMTSKEESEFHSYRAYRIQITEVKKHHIRAVCLGNVSKQYPALIAVSLNEL